MANRELQIKESIKLLKKKIKNEVNANIRDRLRVILFAAKGFTDVEISNKIGFSIQWVKKWIRRYKSGGLDGLNDLLRAGAPMALSEDQIIILYSEILNGPDPDSVLSRYRISDIQKLISKMFGVNYSISGVYVLLKRMNFSNVKPRPSHPRNDPELMVEWKKKPRNL